MGRYGYGTPTPVPRSRRCPRLQVLITRVAFNRTGDAVASGSADGKIRLWDLAADTVRTIETGRPVTAIAMSPAANLLASAGIDGQITIWDLSARPRERPAGK